MALEATEGNVERAIAALLLHPALAALNDGLDREKTRPGTAANQRLAALISAFLQDGFNTGIGENTLALFQEYGYFEGEGGQFHHELTRGR